jgi:hypothetical protein
MEAGFQSALDVRLKDCNDAIWIVVSPLRYWSERLNRLIVVPPWYESASEQPGIDLFFETDLASVPRVPLIYDMWGNRAHREAVLHDYLYRRDSIPVVTRSEADALFLEAMSSTGKSWYIRYAMYWGVRLGGGSSYHQRSVGDKLS